MTTDTSAPRSTPAYPGHQPGTETDTKDSKRQVGRGESNSPTRCKAHPALPLSLQPAPIMNYLRYSIICIDIPSGHCGPLTVTFRFLENLECKYHRITTNNDKSYNDLQLREMFKIAIMFKNKIKISFGDVEVTLDHPLFTTWNYGDRPRFIGEIVTNPSNHVLLSRFDWRNNQERLNFAKPTPQWTKRLDQKCLSRIPISKENTRIVVDAWKAFKQSSPRENISY